MKQIYLIIATVLFTMAICSAQTPGSFNVKGDADKYYPVTFYDGKWNSNAATQIEFGRSSVHGDGAWGSWKGSLMATFSVHITNWGNGSDYIDASIHQYNNANPGQLIAGWSDISSTNNEGKFVIWFRGGNMTYYYNSNTTISPTVYDGVQNALPYQVPSGPALTFKTALDNYVNSYGISNNGSAYFTKNTNNYFAGNVGIGTAAPLFPLDVVKDYGRGNSGKVAKFGGKSFWADKDYEEVAIGYSDIASQYVVEGNSGRWDLLMKTRKTGSGDRVEMMRIAGNGNVAIGTDNPTDKLTVNGTIRSRYVKIDDTEGWADYVFQPDYKLLTLPETEQHIKEKGHLPNIPSPTEVAKNGINVGEMNKKLLEKIEELTLYIIDQHKQINQLNQRTKTLEEKLNNITK